MTIPDSKNSLLQLGWVPYVLILFEMLYMATPFAIFFYSVYQFPLKFLNSNPVTAPLIQTVFPHFIETRNPFLHMLIDAGWLLMLAGLILFLVAFVQIYYAKFTGKGAVTGGLYRFIRHPQYTAWTLFGLGMAMIWSRVIVWVMFITMTFVYYALARAEERECLEKFPDSYPPYLQRTGMFFPKRPVFGARKAANSRKARLNTAYSIALYLVAVGLTVLSAHVLRKYSISRMSTSSGEDFQAVSVSYINPEHTRVAADVAIDDPAVQLSLAKLLAGNDKKVLYVMPRSWVIPELGMSEVADARYQPASRTVSHGNPEDTEPMKKRVLISRALLIRDTDDSKILQQLKRQIPLLYVDIDMEKRKVIDISTPPVNGMYSDIPVPVF